MNETKKIAGGLDTVLKILFWVIVGGVALCTLLMIFSAIIFRVDPAFAQDVLSSVSVGYLELTVAPGGVPSVSAATTYMMIEMTGLLVMGTAACMAIYVLRNILKSVCDRQPFHRSVSANLMKLAWICLGYGVITNLLSVMDVMVVYHGYDLGRILLGGCITNVQANYSFDLGFLWLTFSLILLSRIFQYGAQLQQQVDETL